MWCLLQMLDRRGIETDPLLLVKTEVVACTVAPMSLLSGPLAAHRIGHIRLKLQDGGREIRGAQRGQTMPTVQDKNKTSLFRTK
jgi:hypothetical protein